MQRRLVGSLAAGCCAAGLLAGCVRGDRPGPGTAATTAVTAVTAATATTSTITIITTTSTTSAGPGATPAEVRYLAAARRAYPQRDDQSLRSAGRDICARVAAHSAHDEVGQLAGELGNQAQAKEVVDSATAAFCPASPSATAGSTATS